jgi:glycerate dehydrogenase
MKIVILDGYTQNPGDNPWTPVEDLGDVVIHDRTAAGEILARAADADVLVTNKCPLDAATITMLPSLKFIAVLATGYNVVDVDAAKEHGILVSNVPVYGTDNVAQFAIALTLELCHRIGVHDAAVKAGEWENNIDWTFWKTPQVELAGKTMGIVGFGRIGRRVGELAHALQMRVVAHDIFHGNAPDYEGFEWLEMSDLFAASDVITLHCNLTDDNEHFCNKQMFSLMKNTAFFINCSRGPLVNEHDLAEALNAGQLAGAAVDVVSTEPIKGDNPLLNAKNCYVTPHIAWATLDARKRITQMTAENIQAFIGGSPIHVVNP